MLRQICIRSQQVCGYISILKSTSTVSTTRKSLERNTRDAHSLNREEDPRETRIYHHSLKMSGQSIYRVTRQISCALPILQKKRFESMKLTFTGTL